jgi:hypothetical protein
VISLSVPKGPERVPVKRAGRGPRTVPPKQAPWGSTPPQEAKARPGNSANWTPNLGRRVASPHKGRRGTEWAVRLFTKDPAAREGIPIHARRLLSGARRSPQRRARQPRVNECPIQMRVLR